MQLDGGFELKPHQSIDRYSIGLSHPFIASPTESFTLGTRLYAVDQTTRYKLVGYPLRFDIESNLRALAFEGDWRKADARRLRIISGGLYQGIDGLGAKARSDLDVAKPDLDFFRLRYVTLSYRVPAKWIPGSRGGTLSLAGRNLFLKTDYSGLDPESSDQADSQVGRREYYVLPQLRSFSLSFRTSW